MPSISGLSFSIGNMHLVQVFPVISSKKSLYSWTTSRQHSRRKTSSVPLITGLVYHKQQERKVRIFVKWRGAKEVQMKDSCYLYNCPSQAGELQTRRKLPPKWGPAPPTCCCCWCSNLQRHAWVRKQCWERQTHLWHPNALLYHQLVSKTAIKKIMVEKCIFIRKVWFWKHLSGLCSPSRVEVNVC